MVVFEEGEKRSLGDTVSENPLNDLEFAGITQNVPDNVKYFYVSVTGIAEWKTAERVAAENPPNPDLEFTD